MYASIDHEAGNPARSILSLAPQAVPPYPDIPVSAQFHGEFRGETCRQAILIGVDHNYSAQGKPNTTVISQGDDPDHFDANYFGKGFRWQLPDLETSERAYKMSRQAYERAGRQVLDATVGGKLTIFPKVEYNALFQ